MILYTQLCKKQDYNSTSTLKEKYDQSFIKSISTCKKQNMTPSLYYTYCLQGIPGVSKKTSEQFHTLFPSFLEFINYITTHDKIAFQKLFHETFKKKINKNIIENIYIFFV
jgi:hypothetical protein